MKGHLMWMAFVAGLMVSLAAVNPCGATGELLENQGNGNINWTTGEVEAKGIGVPPQKFYGKPNARPMAIRAAKMDAMRNILEVVKGVRIDSTTKVKNFALESDVIMSRVEGMIQGAEVVEPVQYMSDGTVELIVKMSLSGGFAQLVLPPDIKQIESITPLDGAARVTDDGTAYSGLIVDGRGIEVQPAMAPTILDEEGREVYGAAFASREHAVQQGMSGYCKDLEVARNSPRIGDKPLIVKGIRVEGPEKTDIVISNADAAKLKASPRNLDFLKQCRVMIVVD
jgi:hypothetical protein